MMLRIYENIGDSNVDEGIRNVNWCYYGKYYQMQNSWKGLCDWLILEILGKTHGGISINTSTTEATYRNNSYFTMNLLALNGSLTKDYSSILSFFRKYVLFLMNQKYLLLEDLTKNEIPYLKEVT